MAVPADRRVHRPGQRPRPGRRRRPVRRQRHPGRQVSSDRPASPIPTPRAPGARCAASTWSAPTGPASICRFEIPEALRTHYFREYPFAWFGILAEAPQSAPELIYTHSPRGFALISQRTETLQRMYFQCDPDEDAGAWSDDRIWAELQARVAGPTASR